MRGGGEDYGGHAALLLDHFEAVDGVVAGLERREEAEGHVGVADYLRGADGREESGEERGNHWEVRR